MIASTSYLVSLAATMAKRHLGYYCVLIWRYYLLGAPGILFDASVPRFCPFRLVNGIRVLDPSPETRNHFTAIIDGALTLIKRCDPARFNRVQREIRSIINAPAFLGSSYGRALRVCAVDLRGFYDNDDPNMTTKLLASALILEATFGHLVSRGVLRTPQNSLRVDQSCRNEARRFLQRLGMTKTPWDPDSLVSLSNKDFWKHAVKELYGAATRNSAAEAEVWKKVERRRKDKP